MGYAFSGGSPEVARKGPKVDLLQVAGIPGRLLTYCRKSSETTISGSGFKRQVLKKAFFSYKTAILSSGFPSDLKKSNFF